MSEMKLLPYIPEPMSGCWLWYGAVQSSGYGHLFRGGKHMLAHRYVYERSGNSIGEGLTLDHQCNTPLCVNPEHLKPATQYDNNMRGDGVTAKNKRKTHCVNGHNLADAKIVKRKDGVRRKCLKCQPLYRKPLSQLEAGE